MDEHEIEHDIENLEATNEIIEIDSNVEKTAIYDLKKIEEEAEKEKKQKGKKNKKEKISRENKEHKPLEKKQKIIIIVVCVVLLIAILVAVYFVFFKKDGGKDKNNKPSVIVQKDNYRYEDGTLVLLNEDDKEIGKYECNIKDKDLCYLAKFSDEDDFDEPKYVFENGIEVKFPSKIYNDAYALIYDNAGKEKGLISLYDIKNSEVLGKYKLVKGVVDNKVILKDENDKYGLKDLTDNSDVIKFEYDFLGFMENKDKVIAIKDLHNYLIDLDGKVVTKEITGEIKNYNDKYISALIDNEYSLVDYEGNSLLDDKFNYIRFNDEVISMIKNRKVYLYDNELNKLNIDGITLNKQVYEDKITLDKNYEEVERTYGYTVDTEGSHIILNKEQEDEKIINRFDGLVSGKLKNIDYFDDSLYIYEDEAKTNLLGKYVCDNKNDLKSADSSLSNCYIAKEKVLLNCIVTIICI